MSRYRLGTSFRLLSREHGHNCIGDRTKLIGEGCTLVYLHPSSRMSFEVNSNHNRFQKAFVWAEHGMNMHPSANNIQQGE